MTGPADGGLEDQVSPKAAAAAGMIPRLDQELGVVAEEDLDTLSGPAQTGRIDRHARRTRHAGCVRDADVQASPRLRGPKRRGRVESTEIAEPGGEHVGELGEGEPGARCLFGVALTVGTQLPSWGAGSG